MSALTYNGVRKTFGPNVALEGLDLEVRDGELISSARPERLRKDDRAAHRRRLRARATPAASPWPVPTSRNLPPHKRNMGMVFQSYSLFPNLTVAGNVEYGLRTRNVAKPERHRRVERDARAGATGQRSPTATRTRSPEVSSSVSRSARALAIRPQVLLLDEPLSALDAKVRATLRDEIRRIQTELGITTLFVTHDQEEALAISDRVGVMSNGQSRATRRADAGLPTSRPARSWPGSWGR